MSASVFVISYSYTVTYVTTKMLLLLKEIIRQIGLDPARFTDDWGAYENAVATWLSSRHLQQVTLEVYNPTTNALVTRWDLSVVYFSVGDGALWVDTDAIRYAIAKAGLVPSSCSYEIKLRAPGGQHVDGWIPCEFRSTESFKRYTIGTTIGGGGLSVQSAYWSW